jgi:hypothetical protein
MPNVIGNNLLVAPGQVVHNDGPPVAVVAQPAPVRPARNAEALQTLELKLSDLRLHADEADHTLTAVPERRQRVVDPLQPPVDAQSANLTGKDFLEFLSTDVRLGVGFQMFINDRWVLGDPDLTEEKAQALAERLRPIVAQCYQDSDLLWTVDGLANETLGYCTDKNETFIGQMRDAALISHLKNGNIDDVQLYNIGLSYFKLNAVRSAVGRRSPPGGHAQNVHDYVDAEFGLQETLGLPTRHPRPVYGRQGFITAEVLQDIEAEVKQKLSENNGAKVMEFMSTWEPWRKHVINLAENNEDYKKMTAIYHTRLEKLEAARERQGSPIAALTQPQYEEEMNAAAERLNDWTNQLVGQHTFAFLVNHRADFLIEGETMPRYFNRFRHAD